MEQPEGFIIPGQASKVCCLHKCIYGLKQASRVWGDLFSDFIEHHGFQRSKADPCRFSRVRQKEKTFPTTWVDDVIVASNQQQATDGFLIVLGEKFQALQRYVGIAIARDRKQRKLHIFQPEYISQIVKKFHVTSCSPKSIPEDPNVHLVKPTEKKEEENGFPYREAVGALLYLALVSRPDISFALCQVALFVECYNPSHVKAVRQIICYIHGTPNHGICFAGSNQSSLVGCSDADYDGCPTTRRSVGDWCNHPVEGIGLFLGVTKQRLVYDWSCSPVLEIQSTLILQFIESTIYSPIKLPGIYVLYNCI